MLHVNKDNIDEILSTMNTNLYVVLNVIERHYVKDINPLYDDYFGFLPVFNTEEEAREKFPDCDIVKLNYEG